MTYQPSPSITPRMFASEDEDGALFSPEELRTAILRAYADHHEAAQTALELAEHDPENPGIAWMEALGFLIALVHPHRAERIRRKLGYDARAFDAHLDRVRLSLPW